jgi:hypothetical protein
MLRRMFAACGGGRAQEPGPALLYSRRDTLALSGIGTYVPQARLLVRHRTNNPLGSLIYIGKAPHPSEVTNITEYCKEIIKRVKRKRRKCERKRRKLKDKGEIEFIR